MGRLEGKVVFITGVARGQGRSHAIRFAEEGADIIGIDVLEPIAGSTSPPATQADMDETVAAVEALDRRIVATKADVRSLAQVKKAVDDGVAQLGRLDVVIANAGVSTFMGPAESLSEEAFVDMVDINLTGVWRSCAAAIPHIKAGGRGGSIIMTSSAAGLMAYANVGHYVAAKHGVVGLMRTLALELAPESIRVNSIHPTTVDTPMVNNEATFKLFRPDLENPTADDFVEAAKVMNALPIGWVESVDISNAMVWLASDEARYVTGVTLPVDAGAVIK
ncbi:MAG: mycofactocin-coupled SDR family oxidoreductase [Microcella sp.]|uniref:mycofactocin-coupled SDR family oxidoreductase n=1 Tax=Microcella sp. TaxID=1913979 RepID=UPI0024CB9B0C|nr:mycofactocin-coupled SDR family oxidoreductase [Microcella sp.]UYN83119.1 MAG: mycofactocin-coupled SDR family oxidoreductase [Microcella sp.]